MSHFEHRVRERAYYIWEDEGRVFGRAEDHWLRAENELQARSQVEPVLVQSSAPALTLSASPAEVLGETLKARPSRTRQAAAKVDVKVKTASAVSVEGTQKPVKKVAATKPAAVKAAPKASETKAAKPSKSTAPKASIRSRVAESSAMVH